MLYCHGRAGLTSYHLYTLVMNLTLDTQGQLSISTIDDPAPYDWLLQRIKDSDWLIEMF